MTEQEIIKLKNEAYKKIDKMVLDLVKDENKYVDYLNVQSNLDSDSVGNSLLIASQLPSAKQVKTKENWEKLGYDVIDNKYILKLIPISDMNDYEAVKMYDISQTTSNYKQHINYDNRSKLIALLNKIPLTKKVVNEIKGTDKNALWDWNDKVLYIKRDFRAGVVFKDLVNEYAKSMFDIEDRFYDFKSKSVAYMICNKYNVDKSDFKFNDIPKEFNELDTWSIRGELSNARNVMLKIDTELKDYFNNRETSVKKIDRER